MFKWDYAPIEEINTRIHKLALEAIGRIIFDETDENPDREIRFERITGVMFLLEEIEEDMSACETEKGPSLGDVMKSLGDSVKDFDGLCNMVSKAAHPGKEPSHGTDS